MDFRIIFLERARPPDGLRRRSRPPCPAHTAPRALRPFGRARLGAFTVVELMVVIAVVSLLLGILAPCLAQAQAAARQSICTSNLRQIGLASRFYVNANETYPPAYVHATCRWMDLLKPHLPKDSGVYRCPADTKAVACTWDPEIVLSYGMNTFNFTDNARCFWYGVRATDLPRPERTILLADCTSGKYYCGGGRKFRDPVSDVHYRHPGQSFNALYCDGHAGNRRRTEQRDWDAAQ